jgi:phage gpG-like protein
LLLTFSSQSSIINEAQAAIQNLFEDLDYRDFYQSVGKILLNSIMLNFETEGRRFGGHGDGVSGNKWFDLAPSKILERQRLGFYSINILRRRAGDSGLLGSFNFSASSSDTEVGTNLFYALYLHFGTSIMPPRPLLPVVLHPDDMEDIIDALAEFYEKGFLK